MATAERKRRYDEKTRGAADTSGLSIEELVRRGIGKAREKLIDLTLRNRMLNFKHSETSANHVRIVDESAEFLAQQLASGESFDIAPLPAVDAVPPDEDTDKFRAALKEAKKSDPEWLAAEDAKRAAGGRRRSRDKMAERALRDRVREKLGMAPWKPSSDAKARAAELGINPSYDLLEPGAKTEARHQDNKLQTLFFPDKLESKVTAIFSLARTLQEDAGVSALYCGLGFLEWYESDDSLEPIYAPLVLLPIDMEKRLTQGEYIFSIRGRDEDEVSNVALREKLRQQQIELPEYDPESGVREYVALIGKIIRNKKRWRVRRWATVGIFAFSRQAMWNDLDPERWPAASRPEAHSLLREIYGDFSPTDSGGLAPVHDVDKPEIEAKAATIITDADASQLSAVVDAVDGKNLVIQGPPGTGKSQAITNIIANAMGLGKSVLFVSEKMAALRVVKNRLDHMGLGLYCLEVHSAKASKTQVFGALKERMESPKPRANAEEIERAKESLQEARQRLTKYVSIINAPAGRTGLTVHEVLWGHATRSESPEGVPEGTTSFRFDDSLDMDRFRLSALEGIGKALDEQSQGMGEFAEPSKQPWRGIGNAGLTRFDRAQAVQLVTDWASRLDDIQNALREFSLETFWDSIRSLNEIEKVPVQLQALPEPEDGVDDQILPLLLEDFSGHALKRWAQASARLGNATAKIETVCPLPAAESIAPSIGQIVEQATHAQVYDQPVASLGETATTAERSLGVASSLNDVIRRTLQIAGVAGEDGVKIELFAAGFLRLLNTLPRSAARYRCSSLSQDGAVEELERAQAIAGEAAAALQDAKLGYAISVSDTLPASIELRRCAAILEQTGFLGRLFGRDWREAQRLWQGLVPTERKPKPGDAARRLNALALWKEKRAELNSCQLAKAAASAHWRDEATPFDALMTVGRWMSEVRRSLPAGEPHALALRKILLAGSSDELNAFLDPALQAQKQNLDHMMAACHAKGQSLASTTEALQVHVSLLRQLHRVTSDLKLASDKSIQTLQGAVALLQDVHSARQQLETEVANCQAIQAIDASDDAQRAKRIEASASYVASVQATGIAKPVATWLLTTGCRSKVMHLQRFAEALTQKLAAEGECRKSVDALLQLRADEWCGSPITGAAIEALAAKARWAVDHPEFLEKQAQLLSVEEEAREAGLGGLIDLWARRGVRYKGVSWLIRTAFYRSAAERLIRGEPALAKHNGRTHEQVRSRFQQLDRQILELNRRHLAAKLHRRPVPPGTRAASVRDYTDYQMLEHQTGLQKPRIALRRLFSRAGGAVRALKPCVMMSPMSVAQYLEPGRHDFDLLVIDEASQMRPEDALGAMLRCSQAVIVGDPEQLPPSPFFVAGEDAGDEDAEDAPEESILELGRRCWKPMRMLEVHYRSRHQSLIAYSNREFYGERLLVYPSPMMCSPDFGVSCRRINGAYEPGQGRNQPEAAAVVEEALGLMRQGHDRSIGIVAVNQAQSMLIERMMDEAFATDPAAQAYRQAWEGNLEQFFVKNLENVQGDERDIILVSTVYGATAEGTFHQNFGPINKAYGHRRLNVLFTRAKQRLTVFTSLDPGRITCEGKQRGVRVLKEFLQYAQNGAFDVGRATGEEPDSDFERWFIDRLKAAGYDAHPQVGVAKYRIDIGVVHPDKPGCYVLGVECDGATYHSSKAARDRDRLRQEFLESLSWKIHRVWSTDWYRDPEREFDRLRETIERLREAA